MINKNSLHYYVDLLRMHDEDHYIAERAELRVNALHNIIRTMKNARHNMICGEDFNNLDWGNIPFNGIYWSEHGKNPCSFMKCNINEWNFMSGHTGEIVRLLFAADCIISGDVNGAIIIWNLNNGLMRFKYDIGPGSVEFLLYYRNALISISSAGKIVGLDLNTGHELYHFYVNSKILLCTLSNSHNCVLIHTSYYYKKSTKIGSRFIAFDAFSGTFLPNEIRTDDFEAVKLVTNNHGDTLAMSKKSVIAFNYLKSNTYHVVTTFPSESINSIHDIAVKSDGEGGLITVEGAVNASSMMWNGKNHQPKFIIYYSFTNPDLSYVKHPSIKTGWVDWGDEDGFGSDFDGEWCMRDKKGEDTVTLQALVSSDHEQFIQDNQEAFNYGAMEEFGLRDAHFEEGDQIISRKTIEDAINSGEAYRILFDNAIVGGAVIKVSGSHGDLELLFISPASHSKGIDIDSSLKFYENIGYTQLTDMVSDEWFDSVKSLVAVLDDKRFKGYYKIDVEVEDWSEFSVEMS